MLKEEIIEKISKYFKLTSYEAEKIYDDIFSIIVSGVKQDNIVDVANFGEFIIKFNDGNGEIEVNGYKKTAEFLATSRLEEDINQNNFEKVQYTPPVMHQEPVSQELTTKESENSHLEDIPFVMPAEELVKKQETINIKEQPAATSKLPENIEKPVVESIQHIEPVKTENTGQLTGNKELVLNEPVIDTGEHTVEDEMRKKREEILSKLTKPLVERKPLDESKPYVPLLNLPTNKSGQVLFNQEKKETESPKIEFPKVVFPTFEQHNTEPADKEIFVPEKIESETGKIAAENIEHEKTPVEEHIVTEPVMKKTSEENDDFSQKSFSDFFTEVKEEKHETVESKIPVVEHVEEPLQHVIPPSVVELHNQINSNIQHESTLTFPAVETPKTPVSTNGNGNGLASGEYRASDNSYYIWYKDVEANAADTQNLSYEYELLYQATKEAEYKSKLKIYVTTFIIFFSIVLVLLIFSPVMYKIFFKPIESPKTENVNKDNEQVEQQSPDNKAQQNVLEQNNTQKPQQEQNNANVTPPVTSNDQQQNNTQQSTTQQNTQQQAPVEQKKSEPPPQQQQTTTQPPVKQQTQNNEPKLDGVTKNSMGWMDDKFKVIYVKLDNGKFTIQESAWDSDQKASKRISAVLGYKIEGLKGSVLKVDLGDKGTWFRARFGEFTTLEEARVKAEELRNKERTKLQASLLYFLLYA